MSDDKYKALIRNVTAMWVSASAKPQITMEVWKLADKEMNDYYIEGNGYKTRYPLFILIIILMFNGFIFSQEKNKDKSKIDFKPGASYQSKLDSAWTKTSKNIL